MEVQMTSACSLLPEAVAGELVLAVDTLVQGVHFPADTAHTDVGHKALAANLSDLAAMGAEPLLAVVDASGPLTDQSWWAELGAGLKQLGQRFGMRVDFRDPSPGPFSVTVHVYGVTPKNAAVRRSGAACGDNIYVTGTLGDAGLALEYWDKSSGPQADLDFLRQRLTRPIPRIAEGMAMRGLASAAIDVSDGLLADLGHLLRSSGVGALLHMDRIPLSESARRLCRDSESALQLALSAGDDYELCVTVPSDQAATFEKRMARTGTKLTAIGEVRSSPGLFCQAEDGSHREISAQGFQHFS